MPIQFLPVVSGSSTGLREFQQRMTEVGRIRTGFYNGRYPEKLDRFRFTSPDEALIRAVAAQFGGEVSQYNPQRTERTDWQVFSESSNINVYVPQQRIDPWLEAWRPGTCIRRCDGVKEQIKQEPCQCAAGLVAAKDICKPTVRVQLMLAEVPGMGTWRLESHGEYAAGELSTLAPFIAKIPMPIPARLRLREETRRPWNAEKQKFETTTFYVPFLDISVATPQQVVLGGDVLSKALEKTAHLNVEAAPARPALEAAPATLPACGAATPDGPCNLAAGHPVGPMYPGHEGHMAAPAPTLTDGERTKALAAVEAATTTDRLKEIIANLKRLRPGVKDERVSGAIKSKAASIGAARVIAEKQAAHQGALKSPAEQGVSNLRGMTPEQFGEMQADPQWAECIARGAVAQDIINAGSPAHWLAEDDQARAYNNGTDSAYQGPADGPPVLDAEEVFDVDQEFNLVYAAAGPLGWSTAKTNDEIKHFCDVEKVGEATGAQLHAMRQAMAVGLGQ